MRFVPVLIAVTWGAGSARATPVRTDAVVLHPGMTHERWHDDAIPAKLDLVRIDLTSAEIQTRATPESAKGKTTSAYAGTISAAVAVNGGAFAVSGYKPLGLAMGDGAMWSQTADDDHTATLMFRRTGEQTTAAIVVPEMVVGAADLPAGTEGVVSGRPLLVRAGSVESTFPCDDATTIACDRAPRAAVGLSADGHTMFVVTVDGWQSGSLGMTAAELATFLRARGADTAMLLDSGSSSTLVLDGAVASHPSDGVERTVANHLALVYGSLPKGEMSGVVCKDSISNCTTPGSPGRITGALVTLDDGRTDTSTTSGCSTGLASCASYDFPGVTPRLACVTVKKAGYRIAHKCSQVTSDGMISYNSVVLVAGTDPVDAGVPDASDIVVDGNGSSSEHPDGGTMTGGGGGGGCCDAGADRSPIAIAAVVLAGWRRRRGKTLRPS